MFDICHWINEPETWLAEPARLRVITDRHSDFWRLTHDGAERDSGHFFGARVHSGFTAQLRVAARCKNQGDHAGIMVRIDEHHWLRAGIGYFDDTPQLLSVLTHGRSDLALGAPLGDHEELWLRVTLTQGTLRVQASLDGQRWPLLRLASLPVAAEYRVGPVCGTPERGGMEVAFSDFSLQAPLQRGLADLS